ncbi:synaptopodin-2 [Spea bombifrons]|uniref:synaptopodin-2 n=1 Tax=Spea bombifrons TaxID=233779 RepID=UPI002349EDB0|nr:synaptopodin-2 [Spea bombifrons]
MGTGDYICVTMNGGAPWGFRLQGGKELQEPLHVSKVRSMSKASAAGLFEGDEVVSINGTPCTDIPYSEVVALIEKSADNLQMLIKRTLNKTLVLENPNGEGEFCNRQEYTESTTLEIRRSSQSAPRADENPEHKNQAFFAKTKGESVCLEKEVLQPHKITPKVIETPKACVTGEIPVKGRTEEGRQGPMVELQLSLPQDIHLGSGTPTVTVVGAETCKSSETEDSLQQGNTISMTEVCLSQREQPVQQSSTTFQIVGRPQTKIIAAREVEDPSFPRVELILDCSGRENESRSLSVRGCVESGEEGGQSETPPSAVSFGIKAEDSEQGEEDQQAERDHIRPNKHRARHARLRRSESLSEKQVKEAKSKCKSIALLLTAAPNPSSKGVLMFKKRRQRARKYTLISYGTGELEQQEYDEDDEGEDENEDKANKENTFEVTLYGASESDLDEDFFSDPDNEAKVVTFDWDTGLVEFEKKLKSGEAMEELPDTKGKGVLMFARRKQRMEQITSEQEEIRKQNMEQKVSVTENISNGVSHQEQHSETVKTQTCVSKSYIEVSQGRVQNGIIGGHELSSPFQSSDVQKNTGLNRTAKPFGESQNRVALPFPSSRSVTSPISDVAAPPPYSSVTPPPEPMYHVSSPVSGKTQAAVWSPSYPTEHIASRDERIAVPASKTGILQDCKRRTGKPMFTFKEEPKVSPNPELLSLVQNTESKRGTGTGNESGPEEDYLSLGAEACNFMQVQLCKQKTPPPVAPKPSVKSPTTVTPVSPVWAPPSVASAPPQVLPSQNLSHSTDQTQPQTTFHSYNPPTSLNLYGPYRGPSTVDAGVNQKHPSKTPPTTPHGNTSVAGGGGPAYEMPALRGKGAELFAKRQSRMEKYVVDSATVQAHTPRPMSPTPSLPSSWKYSSNVRAPPPVAYNPIQSPLYPPAANKSATNTGAYGSKSNKKKPTKALSSLEVMKHQPYQLNSSLFTFQPPSETAASKSETLPPARQAQSIKPTKTVSSTNFQPKPVSPQPFYNAEPSFQPSVFTPTNEASSPVGYPMYPRQESPLAALVPPPRPKFSAKKAGVAAQGRDNGRSLSLPGRSFSSACMQPLASPSSPMVFEPSPSYVDNPATPDTPSKRLTPWEAASKSPLGLVDDAFMPQTLHESISANIVSMARRKTLPAPSAAWKSTSKTQPDPISQSYKSTHVRKQSGVTPVPKNVVSAPSFQCGFQLRHPYSSQHSITNLNNVPLDTRSEYCTSTTRNTNFNAYPRAWRR